MILYCIRVLMLYINLMYFLDKLMYFLYLWYKIEIMRDEFNSFLNYFCLRWVGIDYIKNFLVIGV